MYLINNGLMIPNDECRQNMSCVVLLDMLYGLEDGYHSAPGCRNNYRTANVNIFKFPANTNGRQQWIDYCQYKHEGFVWKFLFV
jgi:hypothetical protein